MGKIVKNKKFKLVNGKLCICLTLLTLNTVVLFAQNHEIDSISKVLRVQKEDTNKVLALSGLAFAFYNNNPDTTIVLAQQATDLSLKLNWPKGVANGYNVMGIAYSVKGDYAKGLAYYDKALKLYEEQHNKIGAARVLGNMGLDYSFQSDYNKALEYDLRGLKIVEELGNKKMEANALGNIGLLYNYQLEYDKGLDYGMRALAIWKETGSKHGELISINVIGNAYFGKLDYPQALKYYQDALVLAKDLGDKRAQAINLGNIGNIYYGKSIVAKKQHNMAVCDSLYKKALSYDLDALKIQREMGNKESQGNSLSNIGSIYLENKEYKEAEIYLKEAISIDSIAGALDNLNSAETFMSQLCEETGRPVPALVYYKKAMVIKDSLFNVEKNKALTKKELTYEFEKQQAAEKAEQDKKDVLALADKRKQQIVIWSTIGGLILVMVFAGFILRSLRLTRKQKLVIERKNQETEEQKKVIEEKNKDIIDSINYAKRLQEAILPPLGLIKKYLPNSFVLYKPKDIVAGDFYWMERVGDTILIAAADCTGHGVPGAMVSVVCSNALNRTVKEFKITEPGKILDKVCELVLETFEKSESNVQDGMDISLCSITPGTQGDVRLLWAGAHNPLWYITSAEMKEITADKQPIGYFEGRKPFTTHTLQLKKDDVIYLMTDGYADQFGGANGKKFKYKPLQQLLLAESGKLKIEEQMQVMEKTFEGWKGNLEQTDDVCLIGIRI